MAPSLIPATKSGELVSPICVRICFTFFANCPNFALFGLVGVLGRSCSQIATQGFLGAYTGIFTAEKKKEYIVIRLLSFHQQDVLTTSLILFIFLT